jgi:hypothetical protein
MHHQLLRRPLYAERCTLLLQGTVKQHALTSCRSAVNKNTRNGYGRPVYLVYKVSGLKDSLQKIFARITREARQRLQEG